MDIENCGSGMGRNRAGEFEDAPKTNTVARELFLIFDRSRRTGRLPPAPSHLACARQLCATGVAIFPPVSFITSRSWWCDLGNVKLYRDVASDKKKIRWTS